MEGKEYIIGVDIGSSNVVMAVGVRNKNGEISVLSVERQKVENCVKDGEVTNHILLGDAIAKTKSALENDLQIRLNSAYVGISGRSVYCVRYEDYVDINETTGVTDTEMAALKDRIEMAVPSGGDIIIERTLLRYTIDDRQEVANPVGAYGKKLSATYLFVMVGKQAIDRVSKAMFRADMKVSGLCINPTVLPDLLLSQDEKEDGVAIVDIGGDLTDLSIVREGKLCYFSSLPIGSSSINDDLHEFLKVPKKEIDLIKHRHGSAFASVVPEDIAIQIRMAGHNKRQILQRNIAEIAEERLKDIAHFIMRELKAAKFSTKIPCGIVLTGGATYLREIDKLFARELNMEVRFGEMLNGLDDDSQQKVCANPDSVAIGLLLYGSKHNACDVSELGLVRKDEAQKTTVTTTSNSGTEQSEQTQTSGSSTTTSTDKGGEQIIEPVKTEEQNKEKEQTTKESTSGKDKPGSGPGRWSGGELKDKTKDRGVEVPPRTWQEKLRDWIDKKFNDGDDFI